MGEENPGKVGLLGMVVTLEGRVEEGMVVWMADEMVAEIMVMVTVEEMGAEEMVARKEAKEKKVE